MNSEEQTEVPIILATSCLVEECEITYTSYEDIKRKINEYIGGQVVSQELPDSYVVNGRLNLFMIKPSLEDPTQFIVSAYTYDKIRYGCSFWNYIEYEFELLCEYLDREYAHAVASLEKDSVLLGEETLTGFSSYEDFKLALRHAIECCNKDPYDIKEKELQESWFIIKWFVNYPTVYKMYLFIPKDRVRYVKYPEKLVYYMENYRDCVEKHRAEEEAYYNKQYEEYLQLNPLEDLEDLEAEDPVASSNEVVEDLDDDCPPLGIATAENFARANEILSAYKDKDEDDDDIDTWLAKYIEANRIRSSEPKPPLINEDDEDIYVYDGVNIYE